MIGLQEIREDNHMSIEHCDCPLSIEQQRYKSRIELQRHQRRYVRRMQFYALGVISGMVLFLLLS